MNQLTVPPTKLNQPKNKRKRSCLSILLVVLLLMIAVLGIIALFVLLNPISSVINTIGFAVSGRLHFPTQRIGEIVTDDTGQSYTVFREVVVDPAKSQPQKAGAVLTLHFKVTNISPELNQIYSLLPLPLYIGDPGFRSKLFTIHGEDCQSIYEWDTLTDAENYAHSYALKTIMARAVPGSVHYQILAKQN